MKRFIYLTLFFLPLIAKAQTIPYGEIGFLGGASYYLGERNPGVPFKNSSLALGVFIKHNFNNRLSTEVGFYAGGADRTLITEISLRGEFNFYDYFIGAEKYNIAPFLFGGVGFSKGLIFPFGLGIKYTPSNNIGIIAEWGMRKTFTDKIDDLSDNKELMQDDSYNDWYSFAGIKISFRINYMKKVDCLDRFQ